MNVEKQSNWKNQSKQLARMIVPPAATSFGPTACMDEAYLLWVFAFHPLVKHLPPSSRSGGGSCVPCPDPSVSVGPVVTHVNKMPNSSVRPSCAILHSAPNEIRHWLTAATLSPYTYFPAMLTSLSDLHLRCQKEMLARQAQRRTVL